MSDAVSWPHALRVAAMGLAILFSILLLLSFYAWYLRRNGMFFPAQYPEGEWNTGSSGIIREEHEIPTGSGAKLHAWYFPAGDSAPVLLWCHGNAGNITTRRDIAERLAGEGVSVLLFDYRGFGKSDGHATEQHALEDSIAAYDYVRASMGVPSSRIVLYGESIGGAMAAWVASRRPVAGVVIESSFPSLQALVRTLYPRPLDLFASRSLRTAEGLNRGEAPVLILHGRRDEVVAYPLGVQLHQELTVPKRMISYERSGHSEIPYVEPGYYAAVSGFVKERTASDGPGKR